MTFRDSIATAIDRNKGLCVVLSSFIYGIVLWGFAYTFTIIFVYIQEEFNSSTTATGWVGSAYYGLSNTLVIVMALLLKRFKYRTICLSGTVLAGLSLLASSFVQSIHGLFITYGVLYSTGTCLAFYVTIDLMKIFYSNSSKITRVSCFASMGGTVGLFIQSPLVGKLLTAIGWRSVLRIYSGLTLIVGFTCSMFMQTPDTRLNNRVKRGKNVDTGVKEDEEQDEKHNLWNVLTYPEWWCFFIGMVLTTTATLFSYVNIVDFMKYVGISPYVSSWILIGAAVADISGKTIFVVFGDRMTFPKLYILPPNNLLLAAIMIVLIYVRTSLHMIILVISMGLLRSIFHAIPWLATIELLGSRRNTESTVLTCLGYGIGSFCGTLVGGMSVDFTGSYDVGLLISCGMYFIGAIFLQAAPLYQKVFAPERYLVDNKMPSDPNYEYIIDSYVTTV
ncbi:monocarboxylate transporter 13-like [Antedon mediterranea]|uniref:monocarboxylate transporter 13-like n=1 Tax=Antedon mediterranea TaxID=105859 RepID=UPI003AF5741B